MFRRHVLMIVDDQKQLRMTLREILNMKGFKVLVSATGEDALRICRRFTRRIDMLITDVQLPRLSGFDLAELATYTRPDMPVLFMSGGLDEQDPAVQKRLGSGRSFLQKPFNIDQLLLKLKCYHL